MQKSILFVLIALFVGCTPLPDKGLGKVIFRYNEASGISSLDPAFARGQADIWACNQLYNGLVQMNDQLEVIPCIAKSWSTSEDGKIYTFYLRDDVFFHNDPDFLQGKGRKVNATDFVYSFNRLLDPALASPGIWVFNSVAFDSLQNAPAFFAPNDSTFIIKLKQPFPPFAGLLTSLYCSVVPAEIIKKYGKDFRKHPVGTGPFLFSMWEERTNLIFLKNENYFETYKGERLPFVDAVSISFINDRQSAFLEFVKSNIDFISGIDASYKDELLTKTGGLREKYQGKFIMETCPYLNTEYMGILMDTSSGNKNPLADIRIRQAINYGFDRKRMITYLRNGIGTPGNFGMVPPGLPSFDSALVKGYDFDPKKTNELLKACGYPGGKGLPEIVMSTTKEYQDLCEFMQGQLSESGIKIKLEVNQGAAHREMVAKQKLAFFRASWIADYPDAENYLSLFYSPNFAPDGPNYTHFKSKEFDKLYEESSGIINDSLRYSYYCKMDQIIMNESPVIVLYYDQVVRLYQNEISGIGKNGMNLLTLKYVRKTTK
ncbi:MAG: ABC transporter substrate-binding protein [Bacteroidetes bacterium]|nr:ABC transporter substrate-binding protein [Bacteroidota bacterium]